MGSDGEAEFQEEETYHPYLLMVSERPLIVRVSRASQFYSERAPSRPQPKLKLRISLKMHQQPKAQPKRKYEVEDSVSNDDDSSVGFITGRSGCNNQRAPRRATKKTKYTVDLENDDDLLMDENDTVNTNGSSSATGQRMPASTSNGNSQGTVNKSQYNVEAPPSGILANLWYSNESVLHVFVIEKILGWKYRDRMERKAHVGMDISRIRTDKEDVPLSQSDESLQIGDDAIEEVLLIKWRGRSYMHCSWELPEDLIRLDPTNTAKGKLKRYYQCLELSIGPLWKKVLSDTQSGVEEDYFTPTYIEVERVFASDESEMDLKTFAKQRGENRRLDKEALRKKEFVEATNSETRTNCAPAPQCVVQDKTEKNAVNTEQTWDPEDYVRYVVKWKGLPAAEMTWEYWKDIKADFVDEVEDYWLRQRSPTISETKFKPHPNVRDFKKLKESPIFGVSSSKRPIVGVESDETQSEVDENEVSLKLRSYQLEGVNWLLWNWWNGRSCILAGKSRLNLLAALLFL